MRRVDAETELQLVTIRATLEDRIKQFEKFTTQKEIKEFNQKQKAVTKQTRPETESKKTKTERQPLNLLVEPDKNKKQPLHQYEGPFVQTEQVVVEQAPIIDEISSDIELETQNTKCRETLKDRLEQLKNQTMMEKEDKYFKQQQQEREQLKAALKERQSKQKYNLCFDILEEFVQNVVGPSEINKFKSTLDIQKDKIRQDLFTVNESSVYKNYLNKIEDNLKQNGVLKTGTSNGSIEQIKFQIPILQQFKRPGFTLIVSQQQLNSEYLNTVFGSYQIEYFNLQQPIQDINAMKTEFAQIYEKIQTNKKSKSTAKVQCEDSKMILPVDQDKYKTMSNEQVLYARINYLLQKQNEINVQGQTIDINNIQPNPNQICIVVENMKTTKQIQDLEQNLSFLLTVRNKADAKKQLEDPALKQAHENQIKAKYQQIHLSVFDKVFFVTAGKQTIKIEKRDTKAKTADQTELLAEQILNLDLKNYAQYNDYVFTQQQDEISTQINTLYKQENILKTINTTEENKNEMNVISVVDPLQDINKIIESVLGNILKLICTQFDVSSPTELKNILSQSQIHSLIDSITSQLQLQFSQLSLESAIKIKAMHRILALRSLSLRKYSMNQLIEAFNNVQKATDELLKQQVLKNKMVTIEQLASYSQAHRTEIENYIHEFRENMETQFKAGFESHSKFYTIGEIYQILECLEPIECKADKEAFLSELTDFYCEEDVKVIVGNTDVDFQDTLQKRIFDNYSVITKLQIVPLELNKILKSSFEELPLQALAIADVQNYDELIQLQTDYNITMPELDFVKRTLCVQYQNAQSRLNQILQQIYRLSLNSIQKNVNSTQNLFIDFRQYVDLIQVELKSVELIYDKMQKEFQVEPSDLAQARQIAENIQQITISTPVQTLDQVQTLVTKLNPPNITAITAKQQINQQKYIETAQTTICLNCTTQETVADTSKTAKKNATITQTNNNYFYSDINKFQSIIPNANEALVMQLLKSFQNVQIRSSPSRQLSGRKSSLNIERTDAVQTIDIDKCNEFQEFSNFMLQNKVFPNNSEEFNQIVVQSFLEKVKIIKVEKTEAKKALVLIVMFLSKFKTQQELKTKLFQALDINGVEGATKLTQMADTVKYVLAIGNEGIPIGFEKIWNGATIQWEEFDKIKEEIIKEEEKGTKPKKK
ncbi:Conserved_hypothetical protein [Hexamita inflata]|uniref:Uncharacterized protein n=1 Tax=Hexamita inflata TaxID=28002 RepID=A0AA86NR89_9EUKA|nr:Conserved hypothetical protein [Hexamita inflata]